MKLFRHQVVQFDDIQVVFNKKVNRVFICALDSSISDLYMAYRCYFIAPCACIFLEEVV
ncbi:MAG: hypothetical protein ACJASB_001264 [Shewanella psychromarinicola]|jgi:hypothetical protein